MYQVTYDNHQLKIDNGDGNPEFINGHDDEYNQLYIANKKDFEFLLQLIFTRGRMFQLEMDNESIRKIF